MPNEHISTSSLAKLNNILAKDLFNKLQSASMIERKEDKWSLTKLGVEKGGQLKNSSKYGEYIVWPKSLDLELDEDNVKTDVAEESPTLGSKPKSIANLNATAIGKHFNISNRRINMILHELGFVSKEAAGWKVTKLGKLNGGVQKEIYSSGNLYTAWPEEILTNSFVIAAINPDVDEVKETPSEVVVSEQIETPYEAKPPKRSAKSEKTFHEKFKSRATIRTKDGHWVRSKAELVVDNALYDYGIPHAYERSLKIEETLISDFYIQGHDVYIEYWGIENNPKYLARKAEKIEIYKKYDFKLIELDDHDVSNLDEALPKKLLKFGIKVY